MKIVNTSRKRVKDFAIGEVFFVGAVPYIKTNLPDEDGDFICTNLEDGTVDSFLESTLVSSREVELTIKS